MPKRYVPNRHTYILVDGEFKEEFYSIMLKFRGSSNQRVIDLNKTRKSGEITLFLE